LVIVVVYPCGDPTNITRAKVIKRGRINFVTYMMFIWSSSCIKISVVLLLMRLKTTRKWRMGLLSLLSTITLVAVVFAPLSVFISCIRLKGYWNVVIPNHVCWDASATQVSVYVQSGKLRPMWDCRRWLTGL
jgi:hypothetical protein